MRRWWLPAVAAAVAVAAHAAEYGAVQMDKSRIAFVSKQMDVPVDGEFKTFAAQIAIDPAKPEAGRARIDVQLASIDAGGPEVNDEVKGKNWFDVAHYPTATFVSSAVKNLGGGRFEADGKMSIKGKTVDVRAPFAMRPEGGNLAIDGSFPLKRLAFGIGTGSWGDTSVVADEVQIKFHLLVAPAKK